MTGAFLTIRREKVLLPGQKIGDIMDCPRCHIPATQTHFLDVCPINHNAREIILNAVDQRAHDEHLPDQRFHEFYQTSRKMVVRSTLRSKHFLKKGKKILHPLAVAAKRSANLFVTQSM
jgi:hypothetical protein